MEYDGDAQHTSEGNPSRNVYWPALRRTAAEFEEALNARRGTGLAAGSELAAEALGARGGVCSRPAEGPRFTAAHGRCSARECGAALEGGRAPFCALCGPEFTGGLPGGDGGSGSARSLKCAPCAAGSGFVCGDCHRAANRSSRERDR